MFANGLLPCVDRHAPGSKEIPHMHRIARNLAPALLAVALVGGCGGGGDTGSETTTSGGESPSSEASGAVPARGDADLVIWTDALKIDAVKKVADEFAAAQGIKVAT